MANFDFLSPIKTMLSISGTEKDGLLNIYIEIVKQEILNYCNISVLPDALNFVICRMVCDLYRDEKIKSGQQGIGAISSISEDGRSVSFNSQGSNQLITDIQDRITRTTELNRFKKIYKI